MISNRPLVMAGILLPIPGHWIEAGVLYFNSSSDRPNTVSSANVQGSVAGEW